jgi:hypothetical protein
LEDGGNLGLTFIHGSDCEADEHIAHNDQEGMNASVSLKKARLVSAYALDGDMTTEVDNCARGVQDHVIGVEARIVCFQKNLVVDARRCAEEHLKE